jgi:serine/threonine protein kinase
VSVLVHVGRGCHGRRSSVTAISESFFATLECELLDRHHFTTRARAKAARLDFIEGFYNTRRGHSANGMLSPNEYERRSQPNRVNFTSPQATRPSDIWHPYPDSSEPPLHSRERNGRKGPVALMLLGNRYRLLSVLGIGGFGQVWSAYDEVLRVEVAIKQVRLDPNATQAQRAKLISRAEHEARNAAKLRDHPNVVTVHDVVVADGSPWLVMRLVKGRSLAQELTERDRIPVEEATRIAAGILAALNAAHTEGIIHRDVKPGNIMLAEDGAVLLTDFGIAKHETDTTQTAVSQFVGSLAYMAPERLRGQDLPASDLFALGVTLYEAIEGISPFARATPIAVMSAIAMEQPAPPFHAAHLSTLVLSLLEKDPAQRPDARSTLERLSGRIPPTHAGTVHSAPTATNWTRNSPPTSSPPAAAPQSRRRGSTTLKWTAAIAATSLASILIYTRLAPGDPRGNGSSAANPSATQSVSAQAEDRSSRGSESPSQSQSTRAASSSSTQATSSGGSGLPGSYDGTWTGTATQDNFGQVQGVVDVEVDLTGGALGQQAGTLSVSYLTVYTCTFSLILTSAASDGPEVFDARDTGGVCTAPVTVTLQQTSANSLSYNTKAANVEQTVESGTLTRS